MSEKLRESLSAAIDDEADEFELRRVLDEMHKDPSLRELWDRYHAVGRIMRGEPSDSGARLRDRVWAALDAGDVDDADFAWEPNAEAKTRSGSGRWVGRATGVAVAASVAFAIIFGAGIGDEQPERQVAEAGLSIAGPQRVQPSFAGQVSPSDVQRANAYMMHHVQQQALNQPGVTSFVKLVTYEDQ